jgi:hypothetical protein
MTRHASTLFEDADPAPLLDDVTRSFGFEILGA